MIVTINGNKAVGAIPFSQKSIFLTQVLGAFEITQYVGDELIHRQKLSPTWNQRLVAADGTLNRQQVEMCLNQFTS